MIRGHSDAKNHLVCSNGNECGKEGMVDIWTLDRVHRSHWTGQPPNVQLHILQPICFDRFRSSNTLKVKVTPVNNFTILRTL